jgi:N-carbamoyl-L-amino-acid hydrolase
MLAAARSIVQIRDAAVARPGSRATIGRIEAVPGGTNVISSIVRTWLDARAGENDDARALVSDITGRVTAAAAEEGCAVEVVEESWSGSVAFDPALRTRLAGVLGGVASLATGAGHDAGILAGSVPTAMLFVRNPTGISHAPEEFATLDDCLAGVAALEATLRDLLR